MDIYSKIRLLAVAAIPIIFAITLHEAAHGWLANKFGDKTALMMGRVTLNPLKHIDLIGTIILPIIMLFLGGFIFGWAKPVPVSWQNLRHRKRDMALVALAGPFTNLLMALFWAMLGKFMLMLFQGNPPGFLRSTAQFIHYASLFGIQINILLMLLNLLPIPPLDGSRIVSSLLSPSAASAYEKIEPYGIWILLALLVLGVLGYILLPLIRFLVNFILVLFGIS